MKSKTSENRTAVCCCCSCCCCYCCCSGCTECLQVDRLPLRINDHLQLRDTSTTPPPPAFSLSTPLSSVFISAFVSLSRSPGPQNLKKNEIKIYNGVNAERPFRYGRLVKWNNRWFYIQLFFIYLFLCRCYHRNVTAKKIYLKI